MLFIYFTICIALLLNFINRYVLRIHYLKIQNILKLIVFLIKFDIFKIIKN